MRQVKVKICGITNWPDARAAAAAGADFLGFNFCKGSPRYIAPAKAESSIRKLPKKVTAVGVFVNEDEKSLQEIAARAGLNCVQLHGEESPAAVARIAEAWPVIKAVRVNQNLRRAQLTRFEKASALLLDGFDAKKRGGTGKTFDWEVAREAKAYGQIFLAGGLTPENVTAAIHAAHPYAVDVCSGVERKLGKKDRAKMKALMRAVRNSTKSSRARKAGRIA
jgi:phosphoribosylanthranilate isomerase